MSKTATTTEHWLEVESSHTSHERQSIETSLYEPRRSHAQDQGTDVQDGLELKPISSRGHMGDALENLSRALSHSSYVELGDDALELRTTISRRAQRPSFALPMKRRGSNLAGLPEEAGSPIEPIQQGVPPELGTLAREIIFVAVCSSGQLMFVLLLGDVNVNQETFKVALGLKNTELPWLTGAFFVALGLSVILSGSLTDLAAPRWAVMGALTWLTVWNVIGAFTITPSRSIIFFIMRGMQGLAVGVLISAGLSMLGRVYSPGRRKTLVFSSVATVLPCGFWLGCMQGGALSAHLRWIFGTNAMISALLFVAAYFTIPPMGPAADEAGSEAPTLRDYDWKGALCIGTGCLCLLFGLTQGPVARWASYTYILVIIGFLLLGLFFYVEGKVARPMIPNRLWKTPGFVPLMAAWFLGFGSLVGAWQFYALQFFLRIQGKSAITVALYQLPNMICGILATFLVSRLLHVVPGHYIYIASMLAFAIGPAFFLGIQPNTSYFALAMPGIALATFGPDMSFAASSIFITSNVPRSYQGSAGSLLVTIQNLSAAIMTSVGDTIGSQVDSGPDGEIGLKGLKAVWWFAFACGLAGALITAVWVRIPKEEEKEHVT